MEKIIGSKTKVYCVIVAAGNGRRMNLEINKQFLEIDGILLLARTIHAFNSMPLIDSICIVLNKDEIYQFNNEIMQRFCFEKVKWVIEGGSERQKSVYNGINCIADPDGIVLIHDGARPFISHEDISRVIDGVGEFGAVTVAVPVKDTIKIADKDGVVHETLDRSLLWSIQTPQAFTVALIQEAHKKALEDGFVGTDDAVLVERLGRKMRIVMGNYDNLKITTPEDVFWANSLAKKYPISAKS